MGDGWRPRRPSRHHHCRHRLRSWCSRLRRRSRPPATRNRLSRTDRGAHHNLTKVDQRMSARRVNLVRRGLRMERALRAGSCWTLCELAQDADLLRLLEPSRLCENARCWRRATASKSRSDWWRVGPSGGRPRVPKDDQQRPTTTVPPPLGSGSGRVSPDGGFAA